MLIEVSPDKECEVLYSQVYTYANSTKMDVLVVIH